jgi:hypothetical protein
MSVPIAKVFTVTKNEYDLIEDFIQYYGTIFGYENVVIIDNGSDHPAVLDVYERYKSKGITIYMALGYKNLQQAEHFTAAMSKYKNSAEFLIGLDTDCFFCVKNRCDKETIISYLRDLPKEYDIFVMKKFYMSVVDPASPNYKDNKLIRPTDCTTFVLRDGYAGVTVSHVFYRAQNFVSTGIGNHGGITTTNKRFFCDDVAYVHYHDTGKRRHLERCRAILLAYGYINESMNQTQQLEALLQNRDGSGIHRQRQYIEYLKNPDSFFKEDPIPSDVFEFLEVKQVLENR